MNVLVSGSLAYDRILDFQGKFSDSILPDKIHNLNVSFFVPEMQESFGGCAGNIAYTLSLFGETPLIVGRAGNDFAQYDSWLTAHGIGTGTIEKDASLRTSFATIITDEKDNQIAAFYPGAGAVAYEKSIPEGDIAIVSPGNIDTMRSLPKRYRDTKVPFIFDPGQQIPSLSAEDLAQGIDGAKALIVNDYELALVLKKTGWSEEDILAHAEMLVVTMGEKGSRIRTKTETLSVPSAKPKEVLDPTGAGDAYRAGFIAGLARGYPLETCAKLASVTACYTVERKGTQTHSFTKSEIEARYKENYNETITL